MNMQPEPPERGRPGQAARFVSQLTRSTFALVLAGGRSESLGELTDWRCKPAVSFGGKFRIIDFVLSNCVNSGVRRVGVATQYRSQSLIRHLQLAWSFLDGRLGEFIEILPAQQQTDESHWYRGSADAVFQNLREIQLSDPEYVLVLTGDHIYGMDYGQLLAAHVAHQADVTLACVDVPLAQATRLGVVTLDEQGRVSQFADRPEAPAPIPRGPSCALASMGVYVFTAPFLIEQLQRDAQDPDSSHDFARDLIPHCVRHHRVCAQNFEHSRVGDLAKPAYWRDVSSIDAYWEANMDLVQVDPQLNLYDEQWPLWTWQPQTAPAKFVHDEPQRRGEALDSIVAGGCIISGATIRRSMLFSEVRVHSHTLIEDTVVLGNVRVGAHCVLKKCIIDKNCHIPEGTRIGLDPQEDARRFHRTPGGITLVNRNMLGQEEALF